MNELDWRNSDNYEFTDKLDEAGWAENIRKTLRATKGVGLEFIVRDVYTVHKNLSKPMRAVEIARREIEKHYMS